MLLPKHASKDARTLFGSYSGCTIGLARRTGLMTTPGRCLMALKMGSYKLIDILNRYDHIAVETATEFFEKHGLVQLAERVKFGYAADFGATNPLRHVLVTVFGLDARRFIRFCEGMWKDRETPHYEDALAVATLILSVLALFLSPIIGVEYGILRARMQRDKENLQKEDYRQVLFLFKYLALAYALREAYYYKKISKKRFSKLRTVVEREVLGPSRSGSQFEEVLAIWDDFNKAANLPLDERLTKELNTIALSQIKKLPAVSRKAKPVAISDFIVLKGLAVSPGRANGHVKLVQSADDIGTVNKGDICIFTYFNPDMVPAIKRCIASVGLPRCGGRTGHLAIVSRELHIPCVVRIESNPLFENGRLAVVDGTTGTISIRVQ